MEEQGAGILELYEEYPEVLNCGRINGELYGVPAYTAWSTPNIYTVKEDVSTLLTLIGPRWKSLADATDAMLKMERG